MDIVTTIAACATAMFTLLLWLSTSRLWKSTKCYVKAAKQQVAATVQQVATATILYKMRLREELRAEYERSMQDSSEGSLPGIDWQGRLNNLSSELNNITRAYDRDFDQMKQRLAGGNEARLKSVFAHLLKRYGMTRAVECITYYEIAEINVARTDAHDEEARRSE